MASVIDPYVPTRRWRRAEYDQLVELGMPGEARRVVPSIARLGTLWLYDVSDVTRVSTHTGIVSDVLVPALYLAPTASYLPCNCTNLAAMPPPFRPCNKKS
jgi:hypothetical protein